MYIQIVTDNFESIAEFLRERVHVLDTHHFELSRDGEERYTGVLHVPVVHKTDKKKSKGATA